MHAQATRTWVSGVGDDANPCSRTAPCKTFAGAISKTAAGGEIDALDPGGFGALTITKSITLDGGGGQVASVLVAGTNGIVVAAGASDVVIIRNLRLDGLKGGGNGNAGLNGIRFITGGALGIENCVIFGFNNSGIDIEPSTNATVWIQNTTSANNAQHGVLVVSSSPQPTAVTIDHSNFQLNSLFGVAAGNNSKVTVFNSVASGNQFGFVAQPAAATTAELDVHNSTASNNSNTGVFSGGGGGTATVRITGNSIFGNGVAGTVAGAGGTVFTYSNNFIVGAGTLTPATPGPQ
jgi:hypothetical protein